MIYCLRKLVGLLVSIGCAVQAFEIPVEEDLTITTLTNGVQVWLKPHETPRGEISCRIVARNSRVEIPQVFALDCPAHIFEDELPYFVDYCRESIHQQTECDIGIMVVGDFDLPGLEGFLKRAMGIFAARQVAMTPAPVTVWRQEATEGVSCSLRYATPKFQVNNDDDIKQLWVFYLLQAMSQDRFHKALSFVNAEWIFHPEPKYFLPRLQTSARGRQKTGKEADEMLIICLKAMQELKKDGFTKAELSNAKAKLQANLMSFYQSNPNENTLADYYASHFSFGHFSFGTTVPNYEAFMTSSLSLIGDISMQDMADALGKYFRDNSRSVELRVAKDFPQANELIETRVRNGLNDYKADGLMFDVIAEEAQVDLYATLPINEGEAQLIYEIIDIMATHNLAKLLLKKSEMEKRGKKVHHVHPIRFLGTVFTNPYLKKCMAEIMDSFFKWDGFISGLSERLDEEYQKENILPYVPGFCQAVKANPDQVRFYIQKRKWEDLVIYLIKLGS